MAREKAASEPPSLIDYGAPSSGDSSEESSRTGDLRDYWGRVLSRRHRMSVLPWTIKDHSLWKRLVTQYEYDDIIEMIDWWMRMAKDPAKFSWFYMKAPEIYKHIQKKDYGW